MLLCILIKKCTVGHLFRDFGERGKKARTLGWELGTMELVSPWWLDPLCTYSAVRG